MSRSGIYLIKCVFTCSGKIYQCSFPGCEIVSKYKHAILRHEHKHDFTQLLLSRNNSNLELFSNHEEFTTTDITNSNETRLSEFEETVYDFKLRSHLSMDLFVEFLHLLKDPRASTVRISRGSAITMAEQFHTSMDVPIFLTQMYSYTTGSGMVFIIL